MCSGRTGTWFSGSPVAARMAATIGRAGGDRRRLADPAQPVGRVRVGVLEHLDPHRRHVEDGGDQVVGERRVPDLAVRRSGSPPSRPARAPGPMPPWICPSTACGLIALPDVLDAVQLDDLDQAEFGVHVDDRAVRGERVLHVREALAGLRVERLGRPVPPLDGLLDDLVAEQLGQRHRGCPRPPRPPCRRPAAGRARSGRAGCWTTAQRSLAYLLARGLDRAAGDVGLPGRGRTTRRCRPGCPWAAAMTCSTPSSVRTICCSTVTRPWPTSAGGGVYRRGRLPAGDLEPDPGRRVVVEALGEARRSCRPPRSRRRAPRPRRGWCWRRRRAGRAGQARRPRGAAAAAAWPAPGAAARPTGAGLSMTCPVGASAPWLIALRQRSSTGSRPSAAASLSICAS